MRTSDGAVRAPGGRGIGRVAGEPRPSAISYMPLRPRLPHVMAQITDNVVGKVVVGPDGERIGRISGQENDRALLKSETGVGSSMADSLLEDEEGRLAITADQIANVTQDRVELQDIR